MALGQARLDRRVAAREGRTDQRHHLPLRRPRQPVPHLARTDAVDELQHRTVRPIQGRGCQQHRLAQGRQPAPGLQPGSAQGTAAAGQPRARDRPRRRHHYRQGGARHRAVHQPGRHRGRSAHSRRRLDGSQWHYARVRQARPRAGRCNRYELPRHRHHYRWLRCSHPCRDQQRHRADGDRHQRRRPMGAATLRHGRRPHADGADDAPVRHHATHPRP